MNLFNLNNEQILRILTGQEANPNTELARNLIILLMMFFCVIMCIVVNVSNPYEEKLNIKNNKLRIAFKILGSVEIILGICLIALIVNTTIFNTQVVNKYEEETRKWMTQEITTIAEENPLVFSNLAVTKKPFDFDTFTYKDNTLTTPIKLMVGSIDVKANVKTKTITLEPNNIDAAIMLKIQAALNKNDININPKSIELDKTNNQIKALVSDSNEIVTINYSNDIDDTIINIESTGSDPITIELD